MGGEDRLPNNNDLVRAIGDAIIQAADYVNRDAQDYSKSSIKNARIYGNQIKQNSVPGFVLKDGSVPGLKIVDLDFAKIKNVEIGNAHIANAGIDYAKIKDLHADSAYFGSQIFELGLGDELYMGRLRVNAANIAHLEVGELILESSDGTLYRLGVDEDGNVVTSVYEVQYQNIADTTKNLMSQYTIYRGTTAPETPYVGQLWVNTDTDIIKRCISATPEVIWESIKASELHTSFINAVEKGLEILSTGLIDIKNGGNINIQSGGLLNVKASGGINVDSMGTVSIMGGGKISVESLGSVDVLSSGSINLQGSASLNVQSDGTVNVLSGGGIDLQSGGSLNVLSGGGVELQSGGSISVLGGGDISVDSGGNISLETGAKLNLRSGADIEVESGGNMTVASGGNITIESGGGLYLSSASQITIGTNPLKVGGANLVPMSSDFTTLQGWSVYSPGGTTTMSPYVEGDTYILAVVNPEAGAAVISPLLVPHTFVSGSVYTLSFIGGYANLEARLSDADGGNVIVFGSLTREPAGGSYYKYTATATVTGVENAKRLIVWFSSGFSGAVGFDKFKVEQGNIPTSWSPSSNDPAKGVQTSKITVDSYGIDVASGGDINIASGADMTISAGGNFNLGAGTGASGIGMSNNRVDGYMLWAGSVTPASAPFSVKMDGSVKATNLQQIYSQSFWDMADDVVPAEFSVYIPSGYTMDSVAFTFKTGKARTFAKGASSGGGQTSSSVAQKEYTSAASATTTTENSTSGETIPSNEGQGTTGAANPNYTNTVDGTTYDHSHTLSSHTHNMAHWHYLPQHTHGLNSHRHSITIDSHDHTIEDHTHGLDYGINEKSTLATACVLKVNATTINAYSPDPTNTIEIKSYLSAGWNTITVQPNDDARISAYVMVKITAN